MQQLEYSGFGLRFLYPDDWELSEEITDAEVSVTVCSPETAFWSATVIRNRPDPQTALRAALLAYQEEYDDPEVSETAAELAGYSVPAVQVEFVCLELTNTAFLSALQTPRFTLLVLYQLNDTELADRDSVLQRINNSLVLEGVDESDDAPEPAPRFS